MELLFSAFILFISLIILFYYRVTAMTSFAVLLALLLLAFFSKLISYPVLIVALISLILLFLLLVVPAIRKRLLTQYLLNLALGKVPKLSAAEQAVLDQAAKSWERELFSGHPDWSQLFTSQVSAPAGINTDVNMSNKKPNQQPVEAPISLSPAEQQFLNHQVTRLCQLLDEAQFDDLHDDLPRTVWDYLKAQGFWGLTIPQAFDGHGFSAAGHAAIITQLATRSYSVAITVMVPNSVGPAELVQHFGTLEQKNYYLPRLAESEEIPCFALTSQQAGSDATHIIDSGVICYGEFQSETVLGIRLNWSKRYITLAPVATLIALAFKLYDPQHLLGEQTELGITLALIPTSLPGVVIGERHRPMHLAFMNGPIQGKDVFIPLDRIIGGIQGIGQGWRMILARFAIGRGISLPALTCSSATVCLASSSAYAVIRQQFRRSIGEFEGVQLKLAKIAGLTYLCKATQQLLIWQIEQEHHLAVASAIAKYHLTEWNREIVNAAMDIHAGKGIQTGSRNYLNSFYMSAPINITVEGANILTHNVIIFAQSVVAHHPYLLTELTALRQSEPQLRQTAFDQVIWSHIGHSLHLFARVWVYGMTGGRLIASKPPDLGCVYWQQQLTRMSAAFLFVVDIVLLMIHKDLKTKEALSSRLGDIFSYLYLASAVIKYYQYHRDDVQEYQLADWCVRFCLNKIYHGFAELLVNFPKKWLGKLLLIFIFPAGNPYPPPLDELSVTIAHTFLDQSALRQRMIKDCYWGDESALSQMENVRQCFLKSLPIITRLLGHFKENKISDFLGEHQGKLIAEALKLSLLSEQEASDLQEMYKQYCEALQVNSYTPQAEMNNR